MGLFGIWATCNGRCKLNFNFTDDKHEKCAWKCLKSAIIMNLKWYIECKLVLFDLVDWFDAPSDATVDAQNPVLYHSATCVRNSKSKIIFNMMRQNCYTKKRFDGRSDTRIKLKSLIKNIKNYERKTRTWHPFKNAVETHPAWLLVLRVVRVIPESTAALVPKAIHRINRRIFMVTADQMNLSRKFQLEREQ